MTAHVVKLAQAVEAAAGAAVVDVAAGAVQGAAATSTLLLLLVLMKVAQPMVQHWQQLACLHCLVRTQQNRHHQ